MGYRRYVRCPSASLIGSTGWRLPPRTSAKTNRRSGRHRRTRPASWGPHGIARRGCSCRERRRSPGASAGSWGRCSTAPPSFRAGCSGAARVGCYRRVCSLHRIDERQDFQAVAEIQGGQLSVNVCSSRRYSSSFSGGRSAVGSPASKRFSCLRKYVFFGSSSITRFCKATAFSLSPR